MNKGFTLIEVIIYIALFSILMGGAYIVAFQLIDNSGKLNTRNTVQGEGNFVMRKLDWALTSVDPSFTTTPSSGTTSNLRVKKYDGTKVEVCLDSNKIKIHEGTFGSCTDPDYLPITTDNIIVKASSLSFQYILASGSGPFGITANFTITSNGVDFPFTITKYIRK